MMQRERQPSETARVFCQRISDNYKQALKDHPPVVIVDHEVSSEIAKALQEMLEIVIADHWEEIQENMVAELFGKVSEDCTARDSENYHSYNSHKISPEPLTLKKCKEIDDYGRKRLAGPEESFVFHAFPVRYKDFYAPIETKEKKKALSRNEALDKMLSKRRGRS